MYVEKISSIQGLPDVGERKVYSTQIKANMVRIFYIEDIEGIKLWTTYVHRGETIIREGWIEPTSEDKREMS